MSTHMPGFQWFFKIFVLFCLAKSANRGIRGNPFIPASHIWADTYWCYLDNNASFREAFTS